MIIMQSYNILLVKVKKSLIAIYKTVTLEVQCALNYTKEALKGTKNNQSKTNQNAVSFFA